MNTLPSEAGSPVGSAPTARDFDLRSASDWGELRRIRRDGPWLRWAFAGLGLALAALGALVDLFTARGVPLHGWSATNYFDAALVPIGVAMLVLAVRPPRIFRVADTLKLSAEGLRVEFSNGDVEGIHWTDPAFEFRIVEVSGWKHAPDRVVLGVWSRGWRTPATITQEAGGAILEEAARQGCRTERREEHGGQVHRTTVLVRSRGPGSAAAARAG